MSIENPTLADVWRLFMETDRQLKETDRQLKESVQETDRQLKESIQETDRQLKESRQETDRQLKESRQETDRQLKESIQETDRQLKESRQATDRLIEETHREIKELGRQIGGLGKKFGSFTEGLALPSMTKILEKQFRMETVSPRVRTRKHGEEIEIDVLAYANSEINQAFVVEVKSHPREESIEQIVKLLGDFRKFFPEHKDKTVFGILAGVDWSPAIRRLALKTGVYVATIHDDIFEMQTPSDFVPKSW